MTLLEDASGDGGKSLLNTNDNGLYMIVHAGPTQSHPDAKILGQIAASLLSAKITLRKINLTGCHTAGGKFSQTSIDKSVLSEFCQTLSAECTGKQGTSDKGKQEETWQGRVQHGNAQRTLRLRLPTGNNRLRRE